MKLVSVNIRKIGDEYLVIIDDRLSSKDLTNAISVNETVYDILEYFKNKDFEKDDVVKFLTDNYEVEKEVAEKDVNSLIERLNSIHLLK